MCLLALLACSCLAHHVWGHFRLLSYIGTLQQAVSACQQSVQSYEVTAQRALRFVKELELVCRGYRLAKRIGVPISNLELKGYVAALTMAPESFQGGVVRQTLFQSMHTHCKLLLSSSQHVQACAGALDVAPHKPGQAGIADEVLQDVAAAVSSPQETRAMPSLSSDLFGAELSSPLEPQGNSGGGVESRPASAGVLHWRFRPIPLLHDLKDQWLWLVRCRERFVDCACASLRLLLREPHSLPAESGAGGAGGGCRSVLRKGVLSTLLVARFVAYGGFLPQHRAAERVVVGLLQVLLKQRQLCQADAATLVMLVSSPMEWLRQQQQQKNGRQDTPAQTDAAPVEVEALLRALERSFHAHIERMGGDKDEDERKFDLGSAEREVACLHRELHVLHQLARSVIARTVVCRNRGGVADSGGGTAALLPHNLRQDSDYLLRLLRDSAAVGKRLRASVLALSKVRYLGTIVACRRLSSPMTHMCRWLFHRASQRTANPCLCRRMCAAPHPSVPNPRLTSQTKVWSTYVGAGGCNSV